MSELVGHPELDATSRRLQAGALGDALHYYHHSVLVSQRDHAGVLSERRGSRRRGVAVAELLELARVVHATGGLGPIHAARSPRLRSSNRLESSQHIGGRLRSGLLDLPHHRAGSFRFGVRLAVRVGAFGCWQPPCSLGGPTEARPGCRSYRVYQDLENAQEWSTSAALTRYLRSDLSRTILAVMESASEPPELRFDTNSDTAGVDLVKAVRGVM
jgi:hypothetical protein